MRSKFDLVAWIADARCVSVPVLHIVSVRYSKRTALLIVGDGLVVGSAQLRPLRELVLRTGRVQLALEPYHLLLQPVGFLCIPRRWIRDFAV